MDISGLKVKLQKFIEDLGYQLYDIQYKPKKSGSILTVYIDKDDAINIDDCVNVSQLLSPYLDELDPIAEEYFLEVSTAGAEKELRNSASVKKAIGKFVHVETYEQKMEGTLESFNGDEIILNVRNKIIKINYEEVNLIRLAIKF